MIEHTPTLAERIGLRSKLEYLAMKREHIDDIVRCVNSHDALVAACKAAKELPSIEARICNDYYCKRINPDNRDVQRKIDILKQLTSALALAEPKKE